MLLSLVKNKQKHKHTKTTEQTKTQQHTISSVYITGGDAIRQLL